VTDISQSGPSPFPDISLPPFPELPTNSLPVLRPLPSLNVGLVKTSDLSMVANGEGSLPTGENQGDSTRPLKSVRDMKLSVEAELLQVLSIPPLHNPQRTQRPTPPPEESNPGLLHRRLGDERIVHDKYFQVGCTFSLK